VEKKLWFHFIFTLPLTISNVACPTCPVTLIRVLVDYSLTSRVRISLTYSVFAKLLIVSRMSLGEHQNKVLADIEQTVY